MAAISLTFPAIAPAVGVTLATLADASTGAPIPLPGVTAFAGPVAVTTANGPGNRFSLTFPAPGSTLVRYAAVVANADGSTSPESGTVPGDATGAAVPAGVYATFADLTNVWSAGEIQLWSNPDPVPGVQLPPVNVAKVQAAFNRATSQIHAQFRASYVIPLVPVDAGELNRIATWEATLAGFYLYQPSAPTDRVAVMNQGGSGGVVMPSNNYAARVRAAMEEMAAASIVQCPGALSAQLASGVSFAPVVVGAGSYGPFGRRW